MNLDRADVVGDPELPGDRSRDEVIDRDFNTTPSREIRPERSARPSATCSAGLDLRMWISGCSRISAALKASHRIQFRCEIFNLFNRQNLATPDANLSSPNFGRITNTVGDPRVVQLALKYVF